MHESPKRSLRPDREPRPEQAGERRERPTAGDRRDAIRRWIDDDDDDTACRGID